MTYEIIIGLLAAALILAFFLIGHITNIAAKATEIAKVDHEKRDYQQDAAKATEIAKVDREKRDYQQDAAKRLTEELEATNDLLQAYREENKRMLDLALRLSQPNTMVDAHRDRASYYVKLQDCAKRLEQAEHIYHDALGHGELDQQLDEIVRRYSTKH